MKLNTSGHWFFLLKPLKTLVLSVVLNGWLAESTAQALFLQDYNATWVDSVFNSMTDTEKIAQLLMPRGNLSGKGYDRAKLKKWVQEYKIGGLVFFAGNPMEQAQLTNELQSLSKTPMLIGADFEWGLGMRLDSSDRFPFQMTLGAMRQGTDRIERMGAEIGRQCRAVGVHINYAPVVDVNNNPRNPVINFRAFGEDKEDVTRKGLAYMKGLQSQRIISTAKHFPGHGDTDVDSHFDLPVIKHTKERLDTVELYPFKTLIKNGLTGIMTAHIHIPSLDPTPNLAATPSPGIITGLLKNELGFDGLVFTDAMDMKGVVKHFPNGEAIVRSLIAGNDIIETFDDVPGAIRAIQDAISTGRISMSMINEKVRKILKAKSWVGLDRYRPVELSGIYERINTIEADVLHRQMAENAITIIKNEQEILPVKNLNRSMAVVSIDAGSETAFQHMIRQYVNADYFVLPPNAGDTLIHDVLQAVQQYEMQIIALHLPNNRASAGYSVNASNTGTLQKLLRNCPAPVFVLFGNPLALDKLSTWQDAKAVLLGYQDNTYTQEAAAMALFGAIPVSGKLPVTVNNMLPSGLGHETEPLGRLSYGVPEMAGIDRRLLYSKVDSVINLGLNARAFPGAALQIVKDGRVIMQKAYGFPTFSDGRKEEIKEVKEQAFDRSNAMDEELKEPLVKNGHPTKSVHKDDRVKVDHLYDLASITKILASAFAFMQWTDAGLISPESTLGQILPELKNSNKGNLRFIDMQTHRSGLKAWIPFWKLAVDTAASYHSALKSDPTLEKEMVYVSKKPGFFKKLLGVKEIRSLDIKSSLDRKPALWERIVNARTIRWQEGTFSPRQDDEYSIQISDSLWMNPAFRPKLFEAIKDSETSAPGQYVYSDLHFYFYPQICKKLTGNHFDHYLHQQYANIGAYSLGFEPLRRFNADKIIPTEFDSTFRHALIHGRVHDEGAAVLNGISGHAGLFGSVNDVSKMMQLFLQKGYYGGNQYINPQTIATFTSYQFKEEGNRRGLIFDKPSFTADTKNAPEKASPQSFGHSGFTGTYTWADPMYNLSYVLLTNRVYPTRKNNKITDLNLRTALGDVIYGLLPQK